MSEQTRVTIAECPCPGTPHQADWVELHPHATIEIGAGFLAVVGRTGRDEIQAQALLAGVFVRLGIRAWSFTDDDARPVPVTPSSEDWPDTVERYLSWGNGGKAVADRAADLYTDEVMRPLLPTSSTPSPGGPTDGSTSASPATGSSRPTRSAPSSQSVTDGLPSGVPGP